RLSELGYSIDKDDLNEIFETFKELADRKREVTDQDLESLMSSRRRIADIPVIYKLEHVQVSTGDHEVPTATVKVSNSQDEVFTDAATGTGPVDAVYQAINRVVGVDNTLTEYRVDAVTEGIDSLGDVTIRIESHGDTFVGRGSDTDIIVASAKAYMNALNRAVSADEKFQN
ncbi:MAG: 2-isopropylmalate synthase, partial [SAR202 cluster bacterium]|nr:2-isopropylmalate synthase [SAR202 cluster bacterium]